MKSLLKRQIRKYLSPQLADNKEIQDFLNAVNNSYVNYDRQTQITQRAMVISSEELSLANKNLEIETETLKNVIKRLKNVADAINVTEIPETNSLELDTPILVEFINNQIKKIVEMNKEQQQLLKNLETKNQELSDYAHMISHDLKSPLRSISTLTTWFKEDYKDKIDPQGNQTLDLVTNNVEKMDALITGILNYTTINEAQIEFYDVDLDKLVNDIVSIIYIPNTITVKVEDNLPKIKGDKFRLQQLFQNLIDNAIKYNDKTEGVINIGVKTKDGEQWFYVSDNGRGIAEKYHEKIFKTFEKLDSDKNDKSTGIGLSIVKRVVEFYGGKINLTSKLGEGSTFYFTLK